MKNKDFLDTLAYRHAECVVNIQVDRGALFMEIISYPEKSWKIMLKAKSSDCPKRYRKWRPPEEGWFCRENNKRCSINVCQYIAEDERGHQQQLLFVS